MASQDCEPSCGPPVPMEFALWAPTAVQVDLVLAEAPCETWVPRCLVPKVILVDDFRLKCQLEKHIV